MTKPDQWSYTDEELIRMEIAQARRLISIIPDITAEELSIRIVIDRAIARKLLNFFKAAYAPATPADDDQALEQRALASRSHPKVRRRSRAAESRRRYRSFQ
jgi:hypothetical protein